MISHLGPQLGMVDGMLLAYELRKEQKIAVVFINEGVPVDGNFHEAQNLTPFGIYLFFVELKIMTNVCKDQLLCSLM